jgi:hypothetical protein
MGTRSLLLIVLGMIVVASAIMIGIQTFHSVAVKHNEDNVRNDIIMILGKCQSWHSTPAILGGGGRDFNQLDFSKLGLDETLPRDGQSKFENLNGFYTLYIVDQNRVQVKGQLKEDESRFLHYEMTAHPKLEIYLTSDIANETGNEG